MTLLLKILIQHCNIPVNDKKTDRKLTRESLSDLRFEISRALSLFPRIRKTSEGQNKITQPKSDNAYTFPLEPD